MNDTSLSYKYSPHSTKTNTLRLSSPPVGSGKSMAVNLNMITTHFSLFSFLFVLLCRGSVGSGLGDLSDCWQQDSFSAIETTTRVDSEGGYTELFDLSNQQLRCAGLVAFKQTIYPKGLVLPLYINAPRIIYTIQGRGYMGAVLPGCPEIYQYFEEKENGTVKKHEHQKITRFRFTDIVAVPSGVAHWFYNFQPKGNIVTVTIVDIRNVANQLDTNFRQFILGGSRKPREDEGSDLSVLAAFDTQLLADSLGVSKEIAEKIQSKHGEEKDPGQIVLVDSFHVIIPGPLSGGKLNGIEGAGCPGRFAVNIGERWRADYDNPDGGWLYSLNSQKYPLFETLEMSVERGVLFGNASVAPHWNVNAHTVLLVTQGKGRVQVVDNRGRRVFDGDVEPGKLVVVPQDFVLVNRASEEGVQWVGFKTHANPVISQIVGKGGYFRAVPEEVIMNSYGLTEDEARKVKYGRGDEMIILSPTT